MRKLYKCGLYYENKIYDIVFIILFYPKWKLNKASIQIALDCLVWNDLLIQQAPTSNIL